MNCDKAQELRDPFADGCLPPGVHREMEEHLAGCELCRQGVQWIFGLRQWLGSSTVCAPPALNHTVLRSIHRWAPPEPLWVSWRRRAELWWRGWNPTRAIAMVAGIPATALLFAVILAQFSAPPLTSWYPVFSALGGAEGKEARRLQLSYVPMLRFVAGSAGVIPDDSFVVLARVHKDGTTRLQEVVEAPRHPFLLQLFALQVEGARQRPAQRKGNPPDFYVIMPYQKISVFG